MLLTLTHYDNEYARMPGNHLIVTESLRSISIYLLIWEPRLTVIFDWDYSHDGRQNKRGGARPCKNTYNASALMRWMSYLLMFHWPKQGKWPSPKKSAGWGLYSWEWKWKFVNKCYSPSQGGSDYWNPERERERVMRRWLPDRSSDCIEAAVSHGAQKREMGE